jgi:hypothetical protein
MRRAIIVATAISSAVGLLVLPACSPQPRVVYAQQQHPVVSTETPVQVFMHESDIHQPYQVLGGVSAMNPGNFRILSLQDALPTLKQRARVIGGNGLIIDSYRPMRTGIFSRGYSVEARIIRLKGS